MGPTGEKSGIYGVLLERTEREREKQNGRRRCTQKQNIKIKHIKGMKYEGVEWIDQTQEFDKGRTLVNTVMDLQNP